MTRRFTVVGLLVGSVLALGLAVPATTVAGAQSPPSVVTAQTWSLASGVPNPPNSSEFYGVSCVSSQFCMGVGNNSTGSSNSTGLAETWNGSTWSVVAVPQPNDRASLYAVSCASARVCMAAGYWDNASNVDVPLIEQWNGSTWAIDTTPTPAGSTSAELDGVSCPSLTFCIAAGGNSSATGDSSLLESWNGTTWALQQNADPAGSPRDITFYGASCSSPTFCLAVGDYELASGAYVPLGESWNGSTWSLQATVDPPTSSSFFEGVDCLSPSFCVAVGSTEPALEGTFLANPLIEQWNGSVWTVATVPTIGAGDYLYGVSCVTVDSCAAVGGYYTTTGDYDDFDNDVLAWDGTSWAHATVPNSADSGSVLGAVSCLSGLSCVAAGNTYDKVSDSYGTLVATAPVARSGYRFVASDGGIFSFGAPFYGSMGGQPLNAPIVGMAVMPDGGGYYEVASDGGVFSFGNAQFYGSMGGKPLNKPIVAIAVTPDGLGYWEVASDGGIFAFGTAPFYGSMGGQPLNAPIVGIAATPSGHGYYEVASDGGIFSFGDAVFAGSEGGKTLNAPIVGIGLAATGGYYEVASDGGMFAFGGAPFLGSMGGKPLNAPIVGFATVPTGGYYEVASDGGIFAFGAVPFLGSMGGQPLNAPIVGMTT